MTLREKIVTYLALRGNSGVSADSVMGATGARASEISEILRVIEGEGYAIRQTPEGAVSTIRMTAAPPVPPTHRYHAPRGNLSLGAPPIFFQTASSTNDIARFAMNHGASAGTLILCGSQSGGRGRFDRKWFSPPGSGLYFTLVLRPAFSLPLMPSMNMAVSLSIADSIRLLTSLPASIKWPNDIVIEGKKCCGILIEIEADARRVSRCIVGVGINLDTSREEFPVEIRETATSITAAGGVTVTPGRMLTAILDRFAHLYRDVEKGIVDEIHRKYRKLSAVIGRHATINLFEEKIEARILDIDEHGRLIVKTRNGEEKKISSGEIIGVKL